MLLRGLASATNGMEALIEKNDSIANNIANVNTVGFKKESVVFQNIFNSAVMQKSGTGIATEVTNIGELSVGSQAAKLTYDFSQGALSRTGCPMDMAIEGDGFFKIQSLNGDISYTRNGSFTLNNNSNLVTKDGEYVLDIEGKRIKVDTKGLQMHSQNDIIVNESGQITINNEKNQLNLQKIGVYDFSNKEDMISVGASKYKPTTTAMNPELKAEKFIIQQGTLEMSNSNIVNEMINSISTSRNYESLSKLTQATSDTLKNMLAVGRVRG